MVPHPDQPGWRPDPAKPGSLRWWNGLDWSDAWRSAGEVAERERDGVRTAVQGSTISPEQVATTTRARAHPLARLAPVIGVLGLVVGAYGIVSLLGAVVSVAGLVLSRPGGRRDARAGRTASLLGLAFSAIGLLERLPALLRLVPGLQDALGS